MGDLFIVAPQEEASHVAAFQQHLMPLVRGTGLRVATSIAAPVGEDRSCWTQSRARESQIVVLLLTSRLLASDEGETLIQAAIAGVGRVIPVELKACTWKRTVLRDFEVLPRQGGPIAARSGPEAAWVEVADAVAAAIEHVAEPGRGVSGDLFTHDARIATEVHALEARLQDARFRRDRLVRAHTPAAILRAIDAEILQLRRKLRERGQLAAGDAFSNGRYILQEFLGKGGFATVWKAQDKETGAPVAVKILHPQHSRDETRRERFRRGGRVMATLVHPGIVRVVESERHERGFDYFVMELVRGGTLREAVLRGRLPQTAIRAILLRVAAGLSAAHAAGHVHRDVKPANILLDESDSPKLTDFDLVGGDQTTGGTHTGALGTFMYAAPEMMERPQDAGVQADVYSLGMTALFCYLGKDLPSTVLRDAEGVIRGLVCPPEIRAALTAATRWEMKDRLPDIATFCEALRAPPLRWAPSWSFGGLAAQSGRTRPAWPAQIKEDRWGAYALFDVLGVVQRMRWVPPGSFLMGSPMTEAGRSEDEGPQHSVTLTQGFWLADTPCTQELWHAVMGQNPSHFRSSDRPVEQVSWGNCEEFFLQLSRLVPGLSPRLPTEAEWEYGCRGGTTGATWLGELEIRGANNAPRLDAMAWYGGNSGDDLDLTFGVDSSRWEDKQFPHTRAGSRVVGRKAPNPFGLHDMLGNVWEWCADWYQPYSAAASTDPTGPATGSWRVLRGGSWRSNARFVRAAYRYMSLPTVRDNHLGFRIAHGSASG